MEDLSTLQAALTRMDDLRRKEGPRLSAVQSEVPGWSAAQHLYHVALATDLALSCVSTLLLGSNPHIQQDLPKSELFQQLHSLGRFPTGTKAPRLVTPPEEVNLSFLEQELATAQAAAEKITGQDLANTPGRIVHEKLGGLDSLEWLCFARMHAEHHLGFALKIIRSGS